jgi:hypothetical protein
MNKGGFGLCFGEFRANCGRKATKHTFPLHHFGTLAQVAGGG